jgi:hypothetical protein
MFLGISIIFYAALVVIFTLLDVANGKVKGGAGLISLLLNAGGAAACTLGGLALIHGH